MSSRIPRIAVVTHALERGGGASTMTECLHRVLNRSGRYRADVISLAMSSSDELSTQLRRPSTWGREPGLEERVWRGIPYVHAGAKYVECEPFRYQPRIGLSELLSEYDLIQVVAGTPPWACAALSAGPPCLLWTATTLWADRATRVLSEPFPKRVLQRQMARRAEAWEQRALAECRFIFALSPYTLQSIQKISPQARTGVACCGVDTSQYQMAARPGGGDYILSVARFSDARKNVGLLLDAYRRLVERNPTAPDLCLVGEAPSAAAMEHITKAGLRGRVRLIGTATPEELRQLYRDARFFVLSSDEEGLGIVLLEAMSCGLAAISTRSGGPELVIADDETGILTPTREVEPLARAMERLHLDSGLREQMGRAARIRVDRQFSLAATARPFLEQYDRTLARVPTLEPVHAC